MNPGNRATVTEYEIARYRPQFKDGIARLQRHLWSSTAALNKAYLEWKYEQNPYLAEPLIYVALSGGNVVGMRGFFGSRWLYGLPAETVTWLHADDLVIEPVHRERGLHAQIMRAALSDLLASEYDYLINLHGSRITALASLAMGWRSVGSVRPVHRQTLAIQIRDRTIARMNRLPWLWRFTGKEPLSLLTGARQSFARLDRFHEGRNGTDSPVFVESAPRSREMAELVVRLEYDGRIRHVRDAPFFDWRFRNPLQSYRFLYSGKDRLDGYLVLQRSLSDRADPFPVNIVDWEAANDRVRADLLRAAIRWGQFPELRCWTASLPAETISLLQDSGFTPMDDAGVGSPIKSLLIKPVRAGQEAKEWQQGDCQLLDMRSWDLRMIYSMAC